MKFNISTLFDVRHKTDYIRVRFILRWTEQKGVYRSTTISPGWRVHKNDFDFKNKEIKGRSVEAIKLRDSIHRVADFVSGIDSNTSIEGINQIERFVNGNNEFDYRWARLSATAGVDISCDYDLLQHLAKYQTIRDENEMLKQEIRVLRGENNQPLRDYIQQFIKLNTVKYSYNAIRKYRTLKRNIELYCECTGQDDVMTTKDQQMIFFSQYVDWLVTHEEKGIKALYENSSVKEEFKLLRSVANTFENLEIKVKLPDFVKDLRVGKSESPFCDLNEILTIYQNRSKAEGDECYAVDLFLFQAFTGLRYNELFHVSKKTITIKMIGGNKVLVLNNTSNKEGNHNTVPLNKVCQEILKRWEVLPFEVKTTDPKTKEPITFPDCALPVVSNKHCNILLHSFLRKIKLFHANYKRVRYRGSQRIEADIPRYKAITTHSARHSYSRILAEHGFSITDIGGLLNHSSQETTNRHYKHLNYDNIQLKALDILNKVV